MDEHRMARYARLHEQLRGLIVEKSPNLIAAMATICAVLHAKMPHHFWTGFYFVSGENELQVGPYQGPVACQVLKGNGVCLHVVQTQAPVVVEDVEAFPGHIACDARSKSEIAVPVAKNGRIAAVFDVDSDKPRQFTEADIAPLQAILSLLLPYL